MILPKINSKTNLDNSATAKLIEFTHKQTLHGGVTLTLAYLRQKYMIIGMRNSVKFCIQRCFTCKRFKTETLKQQMGTLPADRVNISLTFFHSSVDYAGPFNVKSSSIRSKTLQMLHSSLCMLVYKGLSSRTGLSTNGRSICRSFQKIHWTSRISTDDPVRQWWKFCEMKQNSQHRNENGN